MKKSATATEGLLRTFRTFHRNEDSRVWDKSNKVLYDLCKKYPGHTDKNKIRAKLWLIGRAYSVAIERRSLKGKKKMSNDRLYDKVTKGMQRDPRIDNYIQKIPLRKKFLEKRDVVMICKAHNYLAKKFAELATGKRRSLASKYLHFHRPLVPLYDSRARKSIKSIEDTLKKCKCLNRYKKIDVKSGDNVYVSFVKKIFCFQYFLADNKCKKCTMRDIDKYLIKFVGY